MEDEEIFYGDEEVVIEDNSSSDPGYDAKTEEEKRIIAMLNSYYSYGYDDYE